MFTVHPAADNLSISTNGQILWELSCPELWDDAGQLDVGSAWIAAGSIFVSESATFRCEIHPRPRAHHWLFGFRFTFKYALDVERIAITQRFFAQDIRTLNRYYEWATPSSAGSLIDSLTPACIAGQWGQQAVGLEFRGHSLLLVEGTSGQFILFFDHAHTHPRVSHRPGSPPRRDAHYATPERPLEVEAILYAREGIHPDLLTPIPWRYPDGKLSCFVITDHADWDTTNKLDALYRGPGGFNSTRVRTTKSVFYGTVGYETPDKKFQPDGLDVPAFSAIAEELSEAGHEICPHSIVVRPKPAEDYVPMDIVTRALELFARRFASGTWIDHGVNRKQAINYTQLGSNPDSEWYLVDLLKQHGFSSIWSYFDPIKYPVRTINQFSVPDSSAHYLRAALQRFSQGNVWESLNYLKIATDLRLGHKGHKHIENLAQIIKVLLSSDLTTGAKLDRLLGRILNVPKALVAVPYHLIVGEDGSQRGELFPILYCEQGLPIGQAEPDDMMMFATSLVNNLATAWGNLDALIAERGFHIAHTYLCATGLRYGDSAITQSGGQWQVSKAFSDLLLQLDDRIARYEIWNPTMKDCVAWFRTWMQIHVDPIEARAVRIANPTDSEMIGYSLVFPTNARQVSIGNRVLSPKRESPLIYSVDLPPHSNLELNWH